MRRILFAIVLLTTYYLLFTSPALADQTGSITVVPSIVQLDLATDKPQAEIIYKNNTPQTVQLSFFASDFTQLEEGYKISFLSQKDAQNYQYSLSSWVSFSSTNLVLEPGQSGNIIVFVSPDKLSPGGHYGTILAQIETKKDADKNLQIQGILSSLIFVRTNTGREIEKGNIQTFQPIRSFFDFPQSMLLRFNNTGDTTLTPYGLIRIFDPLGHEVSRGILNESSLIALPETIRRFDVPLRSPSGFLLPGIYTGTISMHYGKQNTKTQSTVSFFSQGSIPVIPVAVIVLGLIVLFLKRKQLARGFAKKQQAD